MSTRCKLLASVSLAWLITLFGLVQAVPQTTQNPPPVDESKLPDDKKSLTEVNKELTNPISSIWSITF